MTPTLFTGGVIRTAPQAEPVEWLLVRDDRVEASGRGDAPSADRIVDLEGGVLVPALRDGHVHLSSTGLESRGLSFRGERSARAIIDRLAAAVDRGDLPYGSGFEEPLDGPLTRHELDDAVGDRGALLARADLHSCIVSSALLERIDLASNEGVDRDDEGAPTGFLRERAASQAWRAFEDSLGPALQKELVRAGVAAAYSKGVAEAHEMFVVEWRGWEVCERFLDALRETSLNVPVYLATDDVEKVHGMGFGRIGGDWFLDGSFGSHTAWLSQPYSSRPPASCPPGGVSYRSDEDLFEMFRNAQLRRMQVGVHAIGDAAIEQAVRTWERVATEAGVDAVRACGHRIEHFECASDEHMAAAERLGLRASVQPAFDRLWGGSEGLYAERMGWERAARMNRFRTMLGSGITVGGGSDSTVTPLDPFLQMAALREHHVPGQSFDAAAALGLMTQGVAALAPSEGKRGTLALGSWAEMALLDRDPLAVDEQELLATEVLGTWVAGRRVWPPSMAEAP